jgi:hypothetical protein
MEIEIEQAGVRRTVTATATMDPHQMSYQLGIALGRDVVVEQPPAGEAAITSALYPALATAWLAQQLVEWSFGSREKVELHGPMQITKYRLNEERESNAEVAERALGLAFEVAAGFFLLDLCLLGLSLSRRRNPG